MAFETGTATDSADLLNKLRTFLTSNTDLVNANQEWTEIAYSENGNDGETYLQGQGNGGTDQIFVRIRRFLSGADSYNWELAGSSGYVAGSDFASQPNTSQMFYIHLHNTPIVYWFFANGRHFKIVAKVQTTYQHAYLGFILPFGTPSEYPYPLFVGGTSDESTKRFSENDSNMHAYFRGVEHGSIISHSGQWNKVRGQTPNDNRHCVYPYALPGLRTMAAEKFGGGYALEPVILYTLANYPVPDDYFSEIYGALDGAFQISGLDNSSESVHTEGADTYLAFQNAYHTGVIEYIAYKQE